MVLQSRVQAQQKAAGVKNVAAAAVKYNNRNADANATVQDANASVKNLTSQAEQIQQQRQQLLDAHAAGGMTTADYNAQNAQLTDAAHRVLTTLTGVQGNSADAQNQLGVAGSTYQNSNAGFNTTYTPDSSATIDPKTGQVIQAQSETGTTSIAGQGALQQSAIDRIKQQHPEWTDAQIAGQINSQTPGANSTATNSGQGMNYDRNGIAIPGSEGMTGQDGTNTIMQTGGKLRNNPNGGATAADLAASEAKINQIKGYKSVPIYSDSGEITGYRQVYDPAETSRLQQEARNAQTAKEGGMANYAAGLNEQAGQNTNPGNAGAADTTQTGNGITGPSNEPVPTNPDAFLAGLDAQEQAYAGTTMAPLFEMYKGQYQQLTAQGLRGQALQAAIGQKVNDYVAQQKADLRSMDAAHKETAAQIEQSQLDSAQRTYDQQTRLAEQQARNDQIAADRLIRDQQIKTEKDRQQLLMQNGVSGGWRSSMHTAAVITALQGNENLLSDLKQNKILNGDAWTNKLIDIEQGYHSNVTDAYNTYNTSLQTWNDTLQERASKIDATVFSNEIDQMKAADKLTEDFYKGMNDISTNLTTALVQYNKDMTVAATSAANDLRTQRQQLMDNEFKFAAAYGDTNPVGWSALQAQKQALGLPTYDAVPTISQQDKLQKQQLQGLATGMIGQYKDEKDGSDLGLLGVNSFSSTKYSNDEVARGMQVIQGLLAQGKQSEAKQQILTSAYQGMGQAQQEQVTSQNSLISEVGIMKGEMSQYSPAYGPLWTKMFNSAKPLIAQSQDPKYVDFVSHVNRVLGEERHRLFGAALTETENAQADYYLFNPAVDTAETLQVKLNNLEEIAQRARATRYDTILGNGAYGTLTGSKAVSGAPTMNMPAAPNSSSVPTNVPPSEKEQFNKLYELWNTAPPPGGSFNSPQPGGGNVSGDFTSWEKSVGTGQEIPGSEYHKDIDKYAVDIDGKIGDSLPSPVSGTVIKVVTGHKQGESKSYGNYIIVRDSDGYEHLFGHLSGVGVAEGSTIAAGVPLGQIGNTGSTVAGKGGDGSHVHYRVSKNGVAIDPKSMNKSKTIAKKL
jgi:murein DD-endopeptidase MepM/ murein hydrolase activator NlpD